MNFEQLKQYVKNAGCRLYLYPSKGSLMGGQCAAYFEVKEKNSKGPYICMATQGLEETELCELLLHEFAHFLQWKDGTENKKIDQAYRDWYKWLAGKKKFTEKRIEAIRKMILMHEWDADMRAIELGLKLPVENYDARDVLRGANAYASTIKWSFQSKDTSPWTPARFHFKPRILTKKELLAPLNAKQFRRIDRLVKAAKD
jgi:hypothetical protein